MWYFNTRTNSIAEWFLSLSFSSQWIRDKSRGLFFFWVATVCTCVCICMYRHLGTTFSPCITKALPSAEPMEWGCLQPSSATTSPAVKWGPKHNKYRRQRLQLRQSKEFSRIQTWADAVYFDSSISLVWKRPISSIFLIVFLYTQQKGS